MAHTLIKKDLEEVEKIIKNYNLKQNQHNSLLEWLFDIVKEEFTQNYRDIQRPCIYEYTDARITWLPVIEYFNVCFYSSGSLEVGIPLSAVLKDLYSCRRISEITQHLRLDDRDYAQIAAIVKDEIDTGKELLKDTFFDL